MVRYNRVTVVFFLSAYLQLNSSTFVVDRRKGTLEVALCPLVYREGRYRLLVSFMLKVEAKAKKAVKRRQPVTMRVNGAADGGAASRYAANSVLATGRWAKKRVVGGNV